MRLNHILAVLLLCCFLSCQKEPDESLTPADCRVENIYYFNPDGTPADTIKIEYTGDQVSKVDFGVLYVVPEYTNGLVTKKTYYLPGTTDIAFFDVLTYDPDRRLSRVDVYATVASGVQYSYLFTWNGNQLAKFELYEDTSGTGQVLITQDLFTWSGNNISRVIFNDLEGQYSDTTNYSYDSHLNYFQKNPELLLADGLFFDYYGFSMAFALSENNVVSFDQNTPATTANLTYNETDKQEIASMIIDGNLYSRYKYKCQ